MMNSNYPSILYELSGGSHNDGRIVSIEKENDVILP